MRKTQRKSNASGFEPFMLEFEPKDIREAHSIEKACYDAPWNKAEFARRLKCGNVSGIVCRDDSDMEMMGFAIYAMEAGKLRDELRVLNLTVSPHARRRGVGTLLVSVIDELCYRTSLRGCIDVHERNMGAQFFFREMGWIGSQRWEWIRFQTPERHKT